MIIKAALHAEQTALIAPLVLFNSKKQLVENSGEDCFNLEEFRTYVNAMVRSKGVTPTEKHFNDIFNIAFETCNNGDGVGQVTIGDNTVWLRTLNVDKRAHTLKAQGYGIPWGVE